MTTNDVLLWLKENGSQRTATAWPATPSSRRRPLACPSGTCGFAKRLRERHDLAAVWKTGWYEARMLVAFVADPARVTPAQMDRWTRDFDNWAVCDTSVLPPVRSHAARVAQGAISGREGRRVRQARRVRAARGVGAARQGAPAIREFLDRLPLIEAAATDPRNFVKKGVSWALRSIGRRNVALKAAASDWRRDWRNRSIRRVAGSEGDAHRYLSNPKAGLALARRAK